jgi:signal transduction histidine kinase
MKRAEPVRGYQGGYLIGFMMIGAVALRAVIWFQSESVLFTMVLLLTMYTLLYATDPWLSNRFEKYKFLYFPFQTVLALVLTNLRPFTDIFCLVYIPLGLQAFRAFPRRAATSWVIFYSMVLAITLLFGMGWLEGLALVLLYLALFAFLVSYDFLYARRRADQAESQRLLMDLQSAHRKLQEYTAQEEELTAARERNRLARELHDSVSQTIFSITLTSQAARLLLERDPSRLPEQIECLQKMTEDTLVRLRSLIAQLRPSQKS